MQQGSRNQAGCTPDAGRIPFRARMIIQTGLLAASLGALLTACTHASNQGSPAVQSTPAAAQLALPASPVAPLPPGSWVAFQRNIEPILSRYCFRCHGPDRSENGIRLDLFTDEESLHTRIDTFNKAIAMLYGSKMPPPCEYQPMSPEMNALVGWIEARQKIEAPAQAAR